MIIRAKSITPERRDNIRGGRGGGVGRAYLRAGQMAGVGFVTEMTLDPGAEVGLHLHEQEEELYVVLEGEGTGQLDEQRFAVGPGDAWLCKAGHRHGVVASARAPLVFLAVLAPAAAATHAPPS